MSQLFAKVFQSIYDSSIAEDWRVRVVFQDMLVLADADGVVDVTPESLSRRTNLPLEMVREAIPKLEAPDLSSRTPDHEGRRIIRLDAHRPWGWRIVNFAKYRESASKDMLRMAEAERKRIYRAKYGKTPSPTPPTPKESKTIEGDIDRSGTCPGHGKSAPASAALGGAERISLEKEFERIAEAIKKVKDGASHDAMSPLYTPDERAKLKQLKGRKSAILERLGAVA